MKDCLYNSVIHSIRQPQLSLLPGHPVHSIHHFHISHNAHYLPPKILHNLCFSFLLGITAVPREIENNAYAKFWGQIRCIMGSVEVTYCPCRWKVGWWMPPQSPLSECLWIKTLGNHINHVRVYHSLLF